MLMLSKKQSTKIVYGSTFVKNQVYIEKNPEGNP